MSRADVVSTSWHGGRLSPTARPAGQARVEPEPYEIARRLAPFLRWDQASDVDERSWRLVARTPDFDAWLIAWPPGGRVELHDHGRSRGALTVLRGTLVETVPHWDERGRFDLLRCDLETGVTLHFDVEHVHDVVNESDEPALSLHVYSPALTTMTYFNVQQDQLIESDVRTVEDEMTEERDTDPLRLVAQ